jgi:hypothetical protein
LFRLDGDVSKEEDAGRLVRMVNMSTEVRMKIGGVSTIKYVQLGHRSVRLAKIKTSNFAYTTTSQTR